MLKTVAIKSKKYHLLGTAHISQQSVDEVEKYITDLKPDAVCIEICETRYKNLSDGNRWREMDIIKVIKEKKSGLLLASLLLSAFQRKIQPTAMGKQKARYQAGWLGEMPCKAVPMRFARYN